MLVIKELVFEPTNKVKNKTKQRDKTFLRSFSDLGAEDP